MSFWQLEMYGTLLVGHKPYSIMDKETEVYVIPFANDFQMLRHKLGRSDVGAAVISREHLVQPIFGPGPWSQLRLKVSRFQWSSADTLDVNLSATFCLPLTRQNSSGPFKCRPFSSPGQLPTYVPGPYQKAAPHPVPAPMLAFEIVLKDLEKDKDKDKIYTVFAYTAPLLAPRRQDHTVPWNEWGRRSTFWFPGRFEKASMHGYHVLYKQGTKTVLLDFTPSEVACRPSQYGHVQTPSVEITTTAAFVRIESDGLDYTEYILGENIIALKNTQDLRNEDDAFTVLFPAVKKNVQSSISYTSSAERHLIAVDSKLRQQLKLAESILSLSKGDRHLSSQIKCFGKTVRSSGYGIYFSVYISRLTSNSRNLTAKTIVGYTYVSKAVRFVTAVQIATEKRPTKFTPSAPFELLHDSVRAAITEQQHYRCASFGYVNAAVFIVNTAIFPLVAALRVHAVSGGNWRCVMLVWLLGMVPMGTNIWLLTQETWVVQPQLGCIDTVLTSDTIYNVYAYVTNRLITYTLVNVYRDVLVDIPASDVAVIITRVSAVVSDILVVAATWYYIRHTSSVREQLVHDVWSARPNLTTVMFRDGTLCFLLVGKYSFLGIVLIAIIAPSRYLTSLTLLSISLASTMSSILVSHFLICVREAAERSIQAFSTQSLSFINSQGNSSPSSWLSSKEFASDIVNPSTEGSHANMFADLEDELDPSSEDEVREGSNDGIELEEFTASVHSVDARTS
ncbi:predicted protein [Postia placenta Mad-698-R]|nr:predicted protein [Postia placenta Mad-698-R]